MVAEAVAAHPGRFAGFALSLTLNPDVAGKELGRRSRASA